MPGSAGEGTARNRLYLNRGDGTFVDATEVSGAGDKGYGMGCAVGDYDGDGDLDLYVVNYGANALYRNQGDGRFEAVEVGVADTGWSVGAAFVDYDLDGDLDLYVVNYLDFSLDRHIDCGTPSRGILSYCHPDVYEMAPDVYFRNRGDGTFEEATAEVGLVDTSGKGLGVVVADFTGDGRPDVHVANDSTPNFLYRSRRGGRSRSWTSTGTCPARRPKRTPI